MPYKRILVAFDGSDGSWKALRKAILIARDNDAEIAALSVVERPPHHASAGTSVAEMAQRARAEIAGIQAKASQLARTMGVVLKTDTAIGKPAERIVEFAEADGIDLIVVGRTGRSGVSGMFLGSTADRVVDLTRRDVLVVR